MKFVIVGCGRVGSTLAENLDRAGHEVVIFDLQTAAFDRLPDSFKGTALRGDGTDEEVLRQGGSEGADIFLALTEGDNRNIMAAQLASETLGVPRVIAKINDPVRAEAYASLGLATVCRTNMMVDAISDYLDLGIETGRPGVSQPTGAHTHGPEEAAHLAGAAGVRPLARPVVTGRSITTSGGGGGARQAAESASTAPAAAPQAPQAPQAGDREAPKPPEAARESRGFRFRRG